MSNATYLFEKPEREFHHSEPFWSAYFALLSMYLAKANPTAGFPLWRPDEQDRFHACGILSVRNWSLTNLVVEGQLNEVPFQQGSWPNEFGRLRPDITYWDAKKRVVTFIETKTIGTNLRDKIDLYRSVRDYMREQKWTSNFYYLLSHGHEEVRDWPFIVKHQIPCILWEDVLQVARTTPLGSILGLSEKEWADYTAPPADLMNEVRNPMSP
jgi:hypothetical protein